MRKKTLLIGLALLGMLFFTCGCDETQKALREYLRAHPDYTAIPKDEDGDHLAETLIVVTKDGKPVLDDEGNPVEVPGAREALALAKADDSLLAEELEDLAVLLGIPAIGFLGGLVGRWKPNQRLQLWMTRFDDTVERVQKGRDALSREEKAKMTAAMGSTDPETEAEIARVKARMRSG